MCWASRAPDHFVFTIILWILLTPDLQAQKAYAPAWLGQLAVKGPAGVFDSRAGAPNPPYPKCGLQLARSVCTGAY